MSDGWIKLHRKSLESRVFSDAALWRLWTWCLLRANHAPGFFGGEEILPGSFATGTRVAGEALGLSPSTVHRGLKRLAEWSMVELKVKRGFTIVTVCNYATYQDSNSSPETEVKQKRNGDETLMKPNKNNNNNKNLPPSPPPGSHWKEVEGELLKAGVAKAADAIATALENGCDSDDVMNVVGFWKLNPGKWKPGALYVRVLNLRKGQSVSDLWPEPSQEFKAVQSRAVANKSHAAIALERLSGEQRRERDRQARETRERAFGAKLDAMTRDQLVGVIEKNFAESAPLVVKRLPASGPIKGAVRDELLIHLEVEAGL